MKEKHPIVKAIANFIFFVGRCMLSLRYKVKIEGLDQINPKGPVLFLPNHQAVVDPMVLVSYLYPHKNIVPVITATYYDLPVLKRFFKNWGAVRVSDLDRGSRNINVLNEITKQVSKAFDCKRSIVIYPSGQITGQGFEKILNKKGAWEIVKNVPDDVQIIGVRISGFWGSMWSKAWIGESPDFVKTLLKGLFYVIANILFFLPRRKVKVELSDITQSAKANALLGKNEFNETLEKFYNVYGEEKVSYIKHYFYSPTIARKLPKEIKGSVKYVKNKAKVVDVHKFSSEIITGVNEIIVNVLNLDHKQIISSANLVNDLGADSLAIVEIVKSIEDSFKVHGNVEITRLRIVYDLYLLANGNLSSDETLPDCSFASTNPYRDFIKINTVAPISQLFVNRFKSNSSLAFSYDSMLGEINRKDFLLRVFVIAELIKKKNKSKYVGIMLPALQSTSMLIMATYIAGKIPVMLNWTVGKSIMNYCLKEVDVDCIFTASTFVSRINSLLPEEVLNKIVNLDIEVVKAGFWLKLTGLLKSKFAKAYVKSGDVDATAVILFTSGSENNPKAVPLTHRNILASLRGTLKLVFFERNNILIASLPPFHSFGFAVLSVLPMVTGTRIVYSPDPTDGKSIAAIVKHTRSSLLVTAPGFLNILMNNAKEEDLRSLRYVVSGAESISDLTLDMLQRKIPGAILAEGYGITECSPILSLNPLEKRKKGSVGKIIQGVSCVIADVDSNEVLPVGMEGLICVKGESIFNGYLNKAIEDPFIKIQGDMFYNTGDIGRLDEEGYLYITGRLKRFIKIAGEMISLPMIENLLLNRYGSEDEKVLAVEGNDKVSPSRIVLFTTKELDIKDVNVYLKECKAPPVAKITSVELVDEIPLLGTGKVDYKVLKKRI